MGRLFHPVTIQNIHIDGNIFLAPLAGYTDKAFRTMCIDTGASFTYSEMISAEGIIRENRKSLELLKPAEAEHLFGVQIFTGHPDSAARSVEHVLRFNPSLIDLNCGCPVPKVVRSGAGAALLRDPEKLGRIVRSIAGNTDLPVTVKIRTGWDEESLNYVETAQAARENGAAMICLHGRTGKQGYSGPASLEHIKQLKKHMDIPVFGSGDLFTPAAVRFMLENTGCDGVMIARGAIGNPFIFQQCRSLLEASVPAADADDAQKIEAALKHLDLSIHYFGETRAVKEMKKHFCAYTKGIEGGADLRNRLVHASNTAELRRILSSFIAR